MIFPPLENRRISARKAILEHPGWSVRRLCRETGLTREMITRHRAILIRKGVIEDGPVEGRDGKVYPPGRLRAGSGLMTRIARLRELAALVGDPIWIKAEDHARRIFWQAAEKLTEAAGNSINRLDGSLKH